MGKCYNGFYALILLLPDLCHHASMPLWSRSALIILHKTCNSLMYKNVFQCFSPHHPVGQTELWVQGKEQMI